MLVMAAGELRDPIQLLVLMESDDRAIQRLALAGTMADDGSVAAGIAIVSVGLDRSIAPHSADGANLVNTHARAGIDALGQRGIGRAVFHGASGPRDRCRGPGGHGAR